LPKSFVCVGVTAAVSCDFVVPELGCSSFRWPVVLGAPVPEAAVEEHRDLRFGEDQVRSAGYASDRADVNPVTQAQRVRGGSERPLGAGVASSVRAHDRA